MGGDLTAADMMPMVMMMLMRMMVFQDVGEPVPAFTISESLLFDVDDDDDGDRPDACKRGWVGFREQGCPQGQGGAAEGKDFQNLRELKKGSSDGPDPDLLTPKFSRGMRSLWPRG